MSTVISVGEDRKIFFEPALLFSLFLHALLLFFLIFTTDFHVRNRVVPEKGESQEEIVHATVVPALIPRITRGIQIDAHQKLEPAVKPRDEKVEAKREQAVTKEKNLLKTEQTIQAQKSAQKQALLKDLAAEKAQQKKIQQKNLRRKTLQHLSQKHAAAHFASKMKKLSALSLSQQMREQIDQEKIRLDHLRDKKRQGKIDHYRALILQVISQHWVLPGQFNRRLFADLLIRLDPSGAVQSVDVMKSSGNEALDNSARMAVIRSSPLPVPTDPAAFASFREFVLRVRPENILAGASV